MAGSRVHRISGSHRETWMDRGEITIAGVNAPDRAPETGFRNRRAVVGQPATSVEREPRVDVEEVARIARVELRMSLAKTSAWMSAALSISCAAHHADPGDFCSTPASSGTRGVCGARWAAGVELYAREEAGR